MAALSPGWQKWYDRLDQFPKVGGLTVFAIFCFFATGVIVGLGSLWALYHNQFIAPEYTHALDVWTDKLLWLAGIATGGIIGKRATTKADVIAAATSAGITNPDPDGQPPKTPTPPATKPATDLSGA
jgi:hypothetical protein